MKTVNQRTRAEVLAAFRQFILELKAHEENKDTFSFVALRKKYGISAFAYNVLPPLAGEDITDVFVMDLYDCVMVYRHAHDTASRNKPFRRFPRRIADVVRAPGQRIGKPERKKTVEAPVEAETKTTERASWAIVAQLRLIRADIAKLANTVKSQEQPKPVSWLRRLVGFVCSLFGKKNAPKEPQMR